MMLVLQIYSKASKIQVCVEIVASGLTPFFTFVSQRSFIVLRSKSLRSPLSYPAQTQRSCGV